MKRTDIEAGAASAPLGVVVIGRNEGQRLQRCLESLGPDRPPLVYVDSASSDGSADLARRMDVSVIELGPPLGAGRARNQGFDRLMELVPAIGFVQFVDGDCRVEPGWLDAARRALVDHPQAAVVFGRLREFHPEASVYNKLCDMEWESAIGEVPYCGGIAMYRAAAFKAVGGFNPDVLAAEDSELCVRLRQAGHTILSIEAEMGRHDADMTAFSQWWKRAVRAGQAYAQGAAMHGRGPQRHFVRQCRSNWVWGLVIPLISVALAWPTRGLSLLLWLLYPLLAVRIARGRRRRGSPGADAWIWARYCVVGKFPQALGQIRYTLYRLRGRPPALIEHRRAGLTAVSSTHP